VVVEKESFDTLSTQGTNRFVENMAGVEGNSAKKCTQNKTQNQPHVVLMGLFSHVSEIRDQPPTEYNTSNIQKRKAEKKTAKPFRPPEHFSNGLDDFFIRLSPVHLHAEDFHGYGLHQNRCILNLAQPDVILTTDFTDYTDKYPEQNMGHRDKRGHRG
jgi:hypothetical protein